MKPLHLLRLAGAALALAACSDRNPTAAPPTIPSPRFAVVDGVCAVGTFSAAFSPALTDEEQTVTVTTDHGYNCTVGASSGSSTTVSVQPSLSCLELLSGLDPIDEVITWTGGTGATTSTVEYTSVSVVAGGATTYQGTVTAGRFVGDAVVKVIEYTSGQGTGIPLLCSLGLGTLTRAGGPVVLTITDTSV